MLNSVPDKGQTICTEMKIKFYISLILIMIFSGTSFAQIGRFSMSQINNGKHIDVSFYVRSLGGAEWTPGFASLVFQYNNLAMDSAIELSEGSWDNDSSSEYSDQFIVSYGMGLTKSIEIGLNSFPAAGRPVTADSSLIGIIRFTILDPTVNHNLQWYLPFIAVVDINGVNVTPDLIFTDPDNTLLPVELAGFTSIVNANDVELNWSTSSETNNSGFYIERKDKDNEWANLGFVNGGGTTNERMNYKYRDNDLLTGEYDYRLKQVDYNGNIQYHGLENKVIIGVPSTYKLSQNYPNPFNPTTKISFDIANSGNVSLKLFDLSGKEVATILNDHKDAGYYTIDFNGSNLSSGVYFYSLKVNGFFSTRKMTLIK